MKAVHNSRVTGKVSLVCVTAGRHANDKDMS